MKKIVIILVLTTVFFLYAQQVTSSCGNFIGEYRNNYIAIWHVVVESSKRIVADAHQNIVSACWSPDSRYIAYVTDHNIVRVWDMDTQLFLSTELNRGYHDPAKIESIEGSSEISKEKIASPLRNIFWSEDSQKIIVHKSGRYSTVYDIKNKALHIKVS